MILAAACHATEAVAQDSACMTRAADVGALYACWAVEATELNDRLMREGVRVIESFRTLADSEAKTVMKAFERADQGWRQSVRDECALEMLAYQLRQPDARRSERPIQMEAQRIFFRCVRFADEERIRELQRM